MQIEEKDFGRYKWVMLGLLAFTYFLMHAARQIFNAAFPQIKADLPGTSDAEWGFTRTITIDNKLGCIVHSLNFNVFAFQFERKGNDNSANNFGDVNGDIFKLGLT